jgi:c-di-GMP-binding flagellar brake protein YcgR
VEPGKPTPQADRRRAPRFNISMPVTFTVVSTGRTFAATVDNISLGGVLLLTEAKLEDGDRLVMHLPIAEDMTMRVEASLVRVRDAGEFGVAFVSLTDDELDRLTEFVEQRER